MLSGVIPGETITKDNYRANDGMLYFFVAEIEVFKGKLGRGMIGMEESVEISPTKSADVLTTLAAIPSGIDAEVATKLKHLIVYFILSFDI